jgi:hypothetical protein
MPGTTSTGQQAHGFVDRLDLRGQGLGHRRALGLVLGIPGVAEGRALGVEHAGGVFGGELFPQQLHHRHHTVQRAGGHAPRATQVGQGVEGTVEIAGTVHQQHDFVAHPRIVRDTGRACADPHAA